MPGEETLDFSRLRMAMVEVIAGYVRLSADRLGRGHLSERVLDAMRQVPRHEFVPVEIQAYAYADSPLPIGSGKTISQPFIVALMTDLLNLEPDDKVLEVGTGLGYQAAVLSLLAGQVYSVEILDELYQQATRRLHGDSYPIVRCRLGDGGQGLPDYAPFDKIIVTAAPELIPPALLQQLKPGGRLVLPAGLADQQQLLLVERDEKGKLHTEEIIPVVFSPLVTRH